MTGSCPPRVKPLSARKLYERLHQAIMEGLVKSCHDVSDGGLAAALAESAFSGGYGMTVTLSPLGVENGIIALFSESQSRFVVTVAAEDAAAFEAAMKRSACYRVGETSPEPVLRISCGDDRYIDAELSVLRDAWKKTLDW